jgi:hypothetical protein
MDSDHYAEIMVKSETCFCAHGRCLVFGAGARVVNSKKRPDATAQEPSC